MVNPVFLLYPYIWHCLTECFNRQFI